MPVFRPSAVSPLSLQVLRDAITNHLLVTHKNYVVNFYLTEPTHEVQDIENNIVINAEYPLMGIILSTFGKGHSNFRFGEINPDIIILYRWAVISEDIPESTNSQ